MNPLPPGSTLGVFGSGQLGRMFSLAAHRMGYRVRVYSPERDTPAGQVADAEIVGDYDDADAVAAFCRTVQAVSFEFENVPSTVAAVAERFVPVRPGGKVLHVCQHRLREKGALRDAGLPVPAFAAVRSADDLRRAVESIGRPGVLKTASSGYDGRGQMKVTAQTDLDAAWNELQTDEAIYEAFVAFEKEVSVIGVRDVDGSTACYGPIENEHRHHILDVSRCPASLPKSVRDAAVQMTQSVLEALEVVGVLCVEMFVTSDGTLLINELAPRPHNSGHLTIEAFATSQFEQQVRTVAGMPLGSTEQFQPAAMANLLGDAWRDGEPRWDRALAMPGVSLHLYGKCGYGKCDKQHPQPGRKMGHLTATAATIEEAVRHVVAAREALRP